MAELKVRVPSKDILFLDVHPKWTESEVWKRGMRLVRGEHNQLIRDGTPCLADECEVGAEALPDKEANNARDN